MMVSIRLHVLKWWSVPVRSPKHSASLVNKEILMSLNFVLPHTK